MTSSVGDWSDAVAGALTLMAVAAGPEIAEEVMIRDTFEDACRKADRKRKPEVVAPKEKEAPAATVEALMYSLRERGIRALSEPPVRRRLSELNDEQLIEVGKRLQKLKPEIAPAWAADEIEILFRARTK